MNIIVADRGEGKTTSLLRWAAESPNRIIIIGHARYGNLLQRGQHEWGLRDHQVISLDRLKDHLVRLRGMEPEPEFAIDELDEVLVNLLHVRVSHATTTGDVWLGRMGGDL